jgi:diketogulonate reductase-like aldo/keto reductase
MVPLARIGCRAGQDRGHLRYAMMRQDDCHDLRMQPLANVTLPDGTPVPALGLGTWMMGETRGRDAAEIAALRLGFDLGMTLVDTAEMYGNGRTEELVAKAIEGRRERLFLVSKVSPHNAGRKSAVAACERSLRRLRVEQLDLYLLHWRGSIPLADTVDAFERLVRDGKIARWGVSNFDTPDLAELFALPEGRRCVTNQVLYHLGERGIEWSLRPTMAAGRMPLMAYSPLGQGDLMKNRRLAAIASGLGATPAAVALAWLLRHPNAVVIPKSSDAAHVRANRAAAQLGLDAATMAALDAAFPSPASSSPLAML